MSWDLLLQKTVSTAAILVFFAGMVFFLRLLYGPRGLFRDPRWDAWNEEARIDLERTLDAKADHDLEAAFEAYAGTWFTGEPEHDRHLQLKREHTLRVLGNARELAVAEKTLATRRIARPLTLAALFHDIARFEQYHTLKTFADDLSWNHGTKGAQIIRRQGFLRAEPPEFRRLVMAAVALHNRFAIPPSIDGDLLLILKAVRDADKLDILRVMAENLKPGGTADKVVLLHLEDAPEGYSPLFPEALERRQTALYRDMRYYNDFRILLCTWLYDLHFPASLRIVRREGHLDGIVDGLDGVPEIQEKARRAVERALRRV